MKKTSHDHIEEIFNHKGSPLQKIFEMYKSQQTLEQAFYKDLPEMYHPHVKFLLYKAGILSLGVSNSAMYSRISYEKANLLSLFRKNAAWAGLREIKIKMQI